MQVEIIDGVTDSWEWVEPWLDVWVRDMRDPELRLDAPSKATGFIGGGMGGYRKPAEEWEAQINQRAVDLINATLDGMSSAEVCAVHHVKLHAVYQFRVSAHVLYEQARQRIGVRLRAADFE